MARKRQSRPHSGCGLQVVILQKPSKRFPLKRSERIMLGGVARPRVAHRGQSRPHSGRDLQIIVLTDFDGISSEINRTHQARGSRVTRTSSTSRPRASSNRSRAHRISRSGVATPLRVRCGPFDRCSQRSDAFNQFSRGN